MSSDTQRITEQLSTLNRQFIDVTRLLHVIQRQTEKKWVEWLPMSIALVGEP